MVRVSRRLERIILDSKLLTEEQLEEALAAQNGKGLPRAIQELGMSTEENIAKAIADSMQLEFVKLDGYEIDASASMLISEEIALKYDLIPIGFNGDMLIVAMLDPANIFAIDDIQIMTKKDIDIVVATESDIISTIEKFSRLDNSVDDMVENISSEFEDEDIEGDSEDREGEVAPVVKLINLILMEGVRSRASDIFIEPQEKDVRVRYRIDGVLHEAMRSPKKVQSGMISRIKIMSGIDIAERRKPQDGRFGITVNNETVDFRVATLPDIYGELIVMRLLRKEAAMMELEDLGFSSDSFKRFETSFTKPYGAILITGPTGSGKTTTLYGVLNILNDVTKNLITVEDPVEYRVAGISQVQVNVKANLTFAAALRSILRQDPDILMIGEIRDEETALIAIESALTGHLVLSTLHTNDAAGSLTRLTEMGIEPFLVASGVDCVIAQRLARLLCKECKEPYEPSEQLLKDAGIEVNGKIPTLYRPKGCKKCNNTGYKGRLGIYEILLVTEEIERLAVKKATSEAIKKVGMEQGMKTLRQDGIEKALQGITSIEEVARVTS